MKLNARLVGATIVAAALSMAAAGSAFAGTDTNTGVDTTFVAVGSDTTDDVVSALSTALKDGSNQPYISSYSATDINGVAGGSVTTKTGAFSNPNCTFTRPNGSGAGLNALSQAVQGQALTGQGAGQNGTECVQIARSSSGSNPSNVTPAGSLTYIPFGIDSVSYATFQASTIPHNLDLNTLKAIYRLNGVPGSATCGGAFNKYAPLIPQTGSGTRNFWATVLGITVNTVPAPGTFPDGTSTTNNQWGTCVRDTKSSGVGIQEHDGTVLSVPGSIVPFSTAQFIAQGASVISDNRGGRTVLNAIDFDNTGTGASSVSPFVLQQNFNSSVTAANNAARPIYNVVETAKVTVGNAKYDSRLDGLLGGSTSTLCTNATAKALIQRYGFDLSPSCGSKAKTNT